MMPDAFPLEVWGRIIKHLDYPALQLLRASCHKLHKLPTADEIHTVFLKLQCDFMDDGNVYVKHPCENCPGLVGEDTHSPNNIKLKKCKCGRRCCEIRRPGALRIGKDIAVEYCDKCGTGGEWIKDTLTICKKCWGAKDRTENGKKKTRQQFCKRYGKWLQLVWRSGVGHSSTTENQRELAAKWKGMNGVTNFGAMIALDGDGKCTSFFAPGMSSEGIAMLKQIHGIP